MGTQPYASTGMEKSLCLETRATNSVRFSSEHIFGPNTLTIHQSAINKRR